MTDDSSPEPQVRQPPDSDFEDVTALPEAKERLREAIVVPVTDDRFSAFGASGVLFHGPPGTGKSHFARALTGELDFEYVRLDPTEVTLGEQGTETAYVEQVFGRAREREPCVILVDDFEIVAPSETRRHSGRPSEVVATLRHHLDRIDGADEDVLLVATAAELDKVDSAVRRAGRIDITVPLTMPDEERRRKVMQAELTALTRSNDLTLDGIDWDTPTAMTDEFSVADVVEATERAAQWAVSETDCTEITQEHVLEAIEDVADARGYSTDANGTGDDEDLGDLFGSSEGPPSGEPGPPPGDDPASAAEDDGDVVVGMDTSIEPPDVTFDDVGGLEESKQRLREVVQWPRRYPDRFEELGVDTTRGILLYGPPGTGKTMLAKAVANETDSSFISVAGPEVLDKYVGESEKAVRRHFDTAREHSPSVVFIDELDAIAPQRGGYKGNTQLYTSLVNQLLSELDGFEELSDVVVIGATNRAEAIDPALRRPGRLGIEIRVGHPDESAQREIFRVHTADRSLGEDVDLEWLAAQVDDRYSGADIAAVCEEAAMAAIRESVEDERCDPTITREHFEEALSRVVPSRVGDTGGGGDDWTYY